MWSSLTRHPGLLALKILVPTMLLLEGCASTTITSSANPSRDHARLWRDYATLPVIVLGSAPGHSQAELEALFPAATMPYTDQGRHVVLYVNAAALPGRRALCSDMGAFQAGTQIGDSASVAGALCDGATEVTRARGRVLTHTSSARWLRKDFDTIRDQLYQSLFPGSNDPLKFQEN